MRLRTSTEKANALTFFGKAKLLFREKVKVRFWKKVKVRLKKDEKKEKEVLARVR